MFGHRRVESWRIEPLLQSVKTRQCQSTGEIAVALNRVDASGRVLYPCRAFLGYGLFSDLPILTTYLISQQVLPQLLTFEL